MNKIFSLSMIGLAMLPALSCQANTQQLNQLQTQVEQKAKALSNAASEYQQALDSLRAEQLKAQSNVVTATVATPTSQTFPRVNQPAPVPAAQPYYPPQPAPIAAQPYTQPAPVPYVQPQVQAAPAYVAPAPVSAYPQRSAEQTVAYCRNGSQELVVEGRTPCVSSGVSSLQVQKHFHAD